MMKKTKVKYGDSAAPHLELDGIEVYLVYSGLDGSPIVQIETPEDSDVHEKMRVYMNDSEATSWH